MSNEQVNNEMSIYNALLKPCNYSL